MPSERQLLELAKRTFTARSHRSSPRKGWWPRTSEPWARTPASPLAPSVTTRMSWRTRRLLRVTPSMLRSLTSSLTGEGSRGEWMRDQVFKNRREELFLTCDYSSKFELIRNEVYTELACNLSHVSEGFESFCKWFIVVFQKWTLRHDVVRYRNKLS